MKRKLYVGITFLILPVVLGIGSVVVQQRAAVRAAGVMAPQFEVDPMWPKPLPQPLDSRQYHRRVGRCPGPHLDHSSPRLARKQWKRMPQPILPGGDCCMAAPPVLEFDQAGTCSALGRPGQGYDWPTQPRNHRRLQGQRLDRRQWPSARSPPQTQRRMRLPPRPPRLMPTTRS